ncbi:Fruiting body protein SC14 [Ceratocystis platani]|uniref:Fruiting body protein SC14 n=1 Tax=Ceratocystis fimbriata f. sp. platani TaxID=88771 RepID=A0A0F8BU03_CERFI|nr:Fruiting body protein SC14 [Ceratocystis platani]
MKASIAMAVASAALGLAGPLQIRKLVTLFEVETVTAYVYPNGDPAPAPTSGGKVKAADYGDSYFMNRKKPKVDYTSTSTTTTTWTTAYPVVYETPAPAPVYEPAQSEAEPVYVPTQAPEPVYVPTQEPEPVYAPTQEPEPVYAPVKTPAAPVASTPASTDNNSGGSSESQASLSSHNIHRQNHSASALAWDENLAAYALTAAKNCVFEHDLTPGGGGYGQNIAMFGTTDNMPDAGTAIAQAVTNMWYNSELELFPSYGGEPDMSNFKAWGHFSQIVWKDTQKVGCASFKCAAGTMAEMASWYTVCNYSPPGNFGGQYAENVSPPAGMSKSEIVI